MSAAGLPDVFAVGDTALSMAWNGQPTPGLIEWFWAYLTYQRGIRLITGGDE